jgi:hypothetical protein
VLFSEWHVASPHVDAHPFPWIPVLFSEWHVASPHVDAHPFPSRDFINTQRGFV